MVLSKHLLQIRQPKRNAMKITSMLTPCNLQGFLPMNIN